MPERQSIEQVEYRHVTLADLETRTQANEDGTFSGYANLHEVTDSYGTRFAKGSWNAGGLDTTKRVYLWMHSPDNPIGIFSAREDEKGLFIEGKWDDTDEGRRARTRAASGSAPQLSVGFINRGVDPDDPMRIVAAELREVSQITLGFAATPGAELATVRKAAELLAEVDEAASTPTAQMLPTSTLATARLLTLQPWASPVRRAPGRTSRSAAGHQWSDRSKSARTGSTTPSPSGQPLTTPSVRTTAGAAS